MYSLDGDCLSLCWSGQLHSLSRPRQHQDSSPSLHFSINYKVFIFHVVVHNWFITLLLLSICVLFQSLCWSGQLQSPSRPRQPKHLFIISSIHLVASLSQSCLFSLLIYSFIRLLLVLQSMLGLGNCSRRRDRDNQLLH